ncbi:Uncharacterised protein [Mycobacteroides abscessus]|nr:Uncharacterised protein [Mycobacteroides abscessus]
MASASTRIDATTAPSMTVDIATASPPRTPTSGLTSPATPAWNAPMTAAAVPAISPCRVSASAEAFAGMRPCMDRTRNSAATIPTMPPAPVRATTRRPTANTPCTTSAVRSSRTGATRRTSAAFACADSTSPMPFTANRSANCPWLSPYPSCRTKGEPTT